MIMLESSMRKDYLDVNFVKKSSLIELHLQDTNHQNTLTQIEIKSVFQHRSCTNTLLFHALLSHALQVYRVFQTICHIEGFSHEQISCLILVFALIQIACHTNHNPIYLDEHIWYAW